MKNTIIKLCVCVGLLVIIWSGYAVVMSKVQHRVTSIREDDYSWVAQVDEIEMTDDQFTISGFAFKLKQDAEEGTFSIVLHNLDNDKYSFLDMEYCTREDVNEYFKCKYDYKESGFFAHIKKSKVDLENSDYEILLMPENSREPLRIGRYLSQGNLMYVNPKEYVPLKVAGTDLERIVDEGILLVCKPEENVFVYQFEGALYWLLSPNYGYDGEDTYIQYQMETTQINRLPEQRLEEKRYWGDRGFFFTVNEIVGWNTGDFRIAKSDIYVGYSVTHIWTGKYNDGWRWREDFRPWYDLTTETKNDD